MAQAQARKELGLPQDKKIVVYAGNFTTMGEDKGINDILKAVKLLPEVFFWGVGGSEKDIKYYEREAESLGVIARVRFVGAQLQKTLALYQSAADVLLMPFPNTSHYSQNMSPVKMFEYMASGRPIVASGLPTIREVLNDTNAVVVPPGNPQKLADAIQALLNNPAHAQAIAEQAKKRCAKIFLE